MAQFFPQFPISTFEFDGRSYQLEDLTRRVIFDPANLSNNLWYEEAVINYERPDVLSTILYSDPNYWWVFFLINNRTLNEWPLDDEDFDEVLNSRFSEWQQNQTVRYLINGKEVPAYAWKSFNVDGMTIRYHFGRGDNFQLSNPPNGVTKTVGEPQTLREQLEEVNQSYRYMKIVKKQFLPEFFNDFRERIKGSIER